MFYGQCWTCGERWELGTASTCTCPELVNYTFKMDKDSSITYAFEASMYSNDKMKIDPVTGDVGIGTPQRIWVGLTDEDMAQLRREGAHSVSDRDFKAIEAKLKERNCENT